MIVLARWVFLSVYFLDPPALWPASETTPPATDAPPVLHLVMPLLEQLHRDQAALRQAIDQLGARQEMAFDQQRQGMRDQLHAAQTLFAQREQDLESLRARNRATLTTVSLSTM